MTECAGLWGRLFGHNMKRFILKETPPDGATVLAITENFYLTFPEEQIRAATAVECVVRCVRCGMEVLK